MEVSEQQNGFANAQKQFLFFYLVVDESVENEERMLTETGQRKGFSIYNSPLKPVV